MNKYIERQEIDTEMERRRDEEKNIRTNRGRQMEAERQKDRGM